MKKFTINNKEYDYKNISFDIMCQLEDLGTQPGDIFAKPMNFVRSYFAILADITLANASKEIEAHMASGNTLSQLLDLINDDLEHSDFFQGILKTVIENLKKVQEQEQKEEKKPKRQKAENITEA